MSMLEEILGEDEAKELQILTVLGQYPTQAPISVEELVEKLPPVYRSGLERSLNTLKTFGLVKQQRLASWRWQITSDGWVKKVELTRLLLSSLTELEAEQPAAEPQLTDDEQLMLEAVNEPGLVALGIYGTTSQYVERVNSAPRITYKRGEAALKSLARRGLIQHQELCQSGEYIYSGLQQAAEQRAAE